MRDPGAVAWYCAVKLELAVALTAALLTEQLQSDAVPGRDEARDKLAEELGVRLGVDVSVDDIPDVRHFGQVDDSYVSYEWSEGGMIHVHMAFWVVGAPRIDKIEVPREQLGNPGCMQIDVPLPGQHVVPQAEAADRLATFWDRAYTEFNVAKAISPDAGQAMPANMRCGGGELAGAVGIRQALGPIGEKQVRSPESISYETHAHCLLHGLDLGIAEDASCWNELLEILQGCSRSSREALEAELCEPGSASSETRRSRARLRFVAALAEWVNMHDLHKLYALPPPPERTSAARMWTTSTPRTSGCRVTSCSLGSWWTPAMKKWLKIHADAICIGCGWRGTAIS